MKKAGILIMSAVVVFLVSCNSNQGGRNNQEAKDTSKHAMLVEDAKVAEDKEGSGQPESVEDFIKEAASGSMAEIELGRHAQQNATNQRVKNFGAMMVKDHTRASEELKKVVSGKNMQVPSEIEDKHRRMIDDLKKKTGVEFDKEYMKAMVDDHENDVKFFRKQSEDGKDPDIKAFAGKNVPVLQMHLDSAKAISDAVNR